MQAEARGRFLTNADWFQSVVGGKEVVLRHTSALECLELFVGYLNEKQIEVYAKEKGEFENIDYHVVDSFDGLDVVFVNNILCTSINQTINDMLANYNNIDLQSLVQGLSSYYFSRNESFEGLSVKPEYRERFEELKEWAMEYYED